MPTIYVFLAELRKIMYTPTKSQFYYITVGFKGIKIIRVCFCDAMTVPGLIENILQTVTVPS